MYADAERHLRRLKRQVGGNLGGRGIVPMAL
jgi:hypothetical protein